MRFIRQATLFAVAITLLGSSAFAENFSNLVGSVQTKAAPSTTNVKVPTITWGADLAGYLANGNSLKTKPGSIYQELGLNVEFYNQDNFVQQVKDYLEGKTPFLRGTKKMMGMAADVISSDPRTMPVELVQLSFSGGDHVVSRGTIKTINDLKGKKIACQQGGPHPGFIYDALKSASMTKDDVTIVFVKDLTGDNGPAALFRKDKTVDACCVITPEMIGLCGDFGAVGSGAEGTVETARVVVSTQTMSRSIADVWVVRKDFYDANRDFCTKFVAGYLAGVNELVTLRKAFEDSGILTASYKTTLQFGQKVFGEEVIPTLEIDGHGLLLDCFFVGLPGQISYFEDPGNLSGFAAKTKSSLAFAKSWGYGSKTVAFSDPDFNYQEIAKLAKVEYVVPKITKKIAAESLEFFPDDDLEEDTLVTFTVNFKPNDTTVPEEALTKAIENLSAYGNGALVLRGHSDPTLTLINLIKAGTSKGILKREGTRGSYKYLLNGRAMDITDTESLTKLISAGQFDGNPQYNPRETMQAALNLSLNRSNAVRSEIISYAKKESWNLDSSQIKTVGVGIQEPVVPKPTNKAEAAKNMRVEFIIVKVAAEALEESDFDF